jgi:hypothetical protein
MQKEFYMPMVFDRPLNVEPMSFEKFMEFVSTVDFSCEKSLLTLVPKLHSLSLDSQFLFERLLQPSHDARPRNEYSAQVGALAEGPDFYIRSVIWPPGSARITKDKSIDLGYTGPHDHNFGFLTVGMYGPGYLTEVYEYDYNSIAGFPGEPVQLRDEQWLKLSPGRVMYFRESIDTHLQYPPEDYSISLNVLLKKPLHQRNRQVFFDYATKTVSHSIRPYPLTLFFKAMSFTGSSELINDIRTLARQHALDDVRTTAYEALWREDLVNKEELTEELSRDKNTLMQELLKHLSQDYHL